MVAYEYNTEPQMDYFAERHVVRARSVEDASGQIYQRTRTTRHRASNQDGAASRHSIPLPCLNRNTSEDKTQR